MLLKTNTVTSLFLLLAFAVTLIISCDKNEQPIDTGYVNITIRPNSTEYIQLNNPGGWVYLYANPPSRGVLVYRLSFDEFKAYERTPTYMQDSCCVDEVNTICTKIIVDETITFAVDTCSGSKYLLLDGSVIQGPATYPLVAFRTTYDGEYLHIYN
nr:hypothetical protein [Bacteroidota bacterium]